MCKKHVQEGAGFQGLQPYCKLCCLDYQMVTMYNEGQKCLFADLQRNWEEVLAAWLAA